jgi:hypothetical protein
VVLDDFFIISSEGIINANNNLSEKSPRAGVCCVNTRGKNPTKSALQDIFGGKKTAKITNRRVSAVLLPILRAPSEYITQT